jgi:hypothetical protein
MSLRVPGTNAPAVEITNISSNGIWLWTRGRELFMPYDEFPWFKEVPVKNIIHVEEPSEGHFYWPDLDVDLTAEIIEHPERFPRTMR